MSQAFLAGGGLFKIVAIKVLQVWTEDCLVAKKCKQCKIYWRMCDVYREVSFSQKISQMCKTGLPLQAWVEKTVHWEETLWLSPLKKHSGSSDQ